MEGSSPSANNTFDKAEKVKKNMRGYAEKSKDTIQEMIDSSIRILENAMDENSKTLENLKGNYGLPGTMKDSAGNVKQSLNKSVKLAEDTFDNIINSYTRQMEQIVDFNTKLVDLVKEANPDNADRFLELINENFERTRNAAAGNTKEILDLFNKHSSLTFAFNEKFAKTVNLQIDNLFETQKNSLNKFTNWAAEWWKE
jgi:hypothetical protein